ncbi:DUF4439 domain-containing protein [Luteipulveratus halotolerans]|uniref:DUF4439 domain-containing protein n=1 Tax=Luteipulveratus halotolerans TaxID=1631356 RepID=A0A0L6CIA7_9MICO|nr:DUF4439 domain-containing protein [Luteipulveratus halotolerans]KNX37526.1 hypothetical protein VV01_10785 [Luteipulveratus halotolerans]
MHDANPLVARRALLSAALGVGAAMTLGACSVRLESDAPGIPGLRTQEPTPDQKVLLATFVDVRGLEQTALTSGGVGARLAPVHKAQLSRLTDVIAGLGLTPPVMPANAGSAAPTASGDLAAAELRFGAGAGPAGLAQASAAHLPMLASIMATRGAGALLAGSTPTWPGEKPLAPAVSSALLAAVRPAVYGLETISALTPEKQRKPVRALLRDVTAERSRLEAAAGTTAPAPPLTYRLPGRTDTPAARAQLVTRLLSDVVTAAAGQVSVARGRPGELTGLVALWSRSTARAWQWGVTPGPFPGLQQ